MTIFNSLVIIRFKLWVILDNWAMLDSALRTAHERHQTLMLLIATWAGGAKADVPDWYRKMVGPNKTWKNYSWVVDPEDPRYAEYFGKLIAAVDKRYDGHPDLESVDVSIVGYWGEGAESNLLTQQTREALVNAYTDNFKKTPFIMPLTDAKTNKYGLSQANVGWRVDCLGDMGEFYPNWNHMLDYYPEGIINFGMQDAWEKAPISLEVCSVIETLKIKGFDADYIINQSLKWHISSLNAKSNIVPKEYWPLVNQWLKKMGYRFVLRNFSYPASVAPDGKLTFFSWWENKGVAPIYKKNFLLAIRLINKKRSQVLVTDANITTWLPGDNVYDDSVFIPLDMPLGVYDLQIGIVDRQSHEPKVNLAIEGRDPEGWYPIGKMEIK